MKTFNRFLELVMATQWSRLVNEREIFLDFGIITYTVVEEDMNSVEVFINYDGQAVPETLHFDNALELFSKMSVVGGLYPQEKIDEEEFMSEVLGEVE